MTVDPETLIVDVRNPEEFDDEHYPCAVNIPVDEVEDRVNEFGAKDGKIIVYCHSGRRSGIAKDILEKSGYKDVTNGGGLTDMQHG